MKPLAAAVRTLPARPGYREGATLPFPVGGQSLASLRRLRASLFQEGKIDLALKVAEELVRREPGRESHFRLGFLLREGGRYREALKHFQDALRFRQGARYIVAEIHLHAASCHLRLGRLKEMGQALDRAYSTRWKPRSEAKIHHSLGNALFARGRYRQAFDQYVAAEAGYRTAIERGRAAANQGLSMVRLGQLPEAGRHLDRAIRIHLRGGHRAELAGARAFRAELHMDQGEPVRALGMFLRAAATLRRLGQTAREAWALYGAGYAAGEAGLWTKSRALLDRALRLAAPSGISRVLACAHACRATAFAHDEDFEQARESLERADRLMKGKRDWIVTLHVCRAHARIAALFGRWNEVRAWCRRAERAARRAGDLPRVAEFSGLRARAEGSLGRRRAAFHARATERRIRTLGGDSSEAMRELRRSAAKLAASRSPLLIVGEDGTGTADVALEVHGAGPRRGAPCVVVPCEQLAFPASDLAGHAEGAWSSAGPAAPGYFQKARGGTLVLDRADELPGEAQQVLVRMVEGWIRPVGSPAEERVDVRVIATCRDRRRLIPSLRERLEAAVLRVPSLRERSSEIPDLVRRFLGGRRRITWEAQAALAAHRWEGNLTELRGALERLMALSADSIGVKLVHRVLRTPESGRLAGRVYKKRALAQMAFQMA